MWNRNPDLRSALWAMLPAVILAAGLSAPAGADETVVGSGELRFVAVKSCESPIEICSRSKLTGAVKRYRFTGQEVLPTNDPDVIVVVGGSVITLRDGGAVFSSDTVRVNTVTNEAIHLWSITGGRGAYAGATGSMAAGGDLAAPRLPYVAQVYVPDND